MKTIFLFGLIAVALPARASQSDVGTASAQLLQIGAGARSLGMGQAFTAVAEGPDAAYWNPAGLTRLTGPEAAYTRTELPAGVHHDFFAVAAPSQFLHGTLALAVTRLSQDSIALVNANNETQGSFSPQSEVYALSYGHSFAPEGDEPSKRNYFHDDWNAAGSGGSYSEATSEHWAGELAAGVSFKMIDENLGTRSATAFAADGGVLWRPANINQLILGGAFRNLGSRINFIDDSESLPAILAASAAYDVRRDDWRLLPALEIDAPFAGQIYGALGVEARRNISAGTSAAVRLGYTTLSTADLGFVSGITAGIGLDVGKFSFDAAFQPMAVLGETFRLGVGWKF